ncbi:MAG: ABC transporter permease, partial [Desulfobacterales bacterium]
WKIGLFTLLGLVLIWNMELWGATMSTITLILISTLIAVGLGIPIGILAALSQIVYKIVTPILDVMQTMPAFVYLIPAIPFFGLGAVGAIFSTVVFSIPPCIRLTCLGIRQVPKEMVEAADAFGSSTSQKLFKVQIPIAKTTMMAGINQTIMLALSMVVIAAMIGAGGLGGEVWRAIQRLQMGRGFEAGIGIVIVAIILDRVMQAYGAKGQQSQQE